MPSDAPEAEQMSEPTTAAPANPVLTDAHAEVLLADAIATAEAVSATSSETAPTPWDDPAAAKAEIERLRRENGAARTNAKQAAADEAKAGLVADIAKALGLAKEDEPLDPAKLTEQLTATSAEARQAKIELAVFRASTDASGDPVALLDSKTFLASVKDIDPNDITAIGAAITKAVEANPRLGAATASRPPRPDLSQGSGANGQQVTSPATEFASILQGQLGPR